MKRYGNLYEKIIDIDNIRLAHKNARKNKTKYKEIVEVDKDSEYYIAKIHDMLVNKTYKCICRNEEIDIAQALLTKLKGTK